MPRILAENIPEHALADIAGSLVTELAAALQCPAEWISVSLLPAKRLACEGSETCPVIDVYWFPRNKEMQDAAADVIRKQLRGAGYNAMQVYFFKLEREGFYEFS